MCAHIHVCMFVNMCVHSTMKSEVQTEAAACPQGAMAQHYSSIRYQPQLNHSSEPDPGPSGVPRGGMFSASGSP